MKQVQQAPEIIPGRERISNDEKRYRIALMKADTLHPQQVRKPGPFRSSETVYETTQDTNKRLRDARRKNTSYE